MRRIIIILANLMLAITVSFAQQTERVDLGEATSAITSTVNTLNTIYQEEQGYVNITINS